MGSPNLARPWASGRKGVATGGMGNLFPYPFFKELEKLASGLANGVVAAGGEGPSTRVSIPYMQFKACHTSQRPHPLPLTAQPTSPQEGPVFNCRARWG